MGKPSKYPGYRTMTGAQRRNARQARMARIWEAVKDAQTRYASSRIPATDETDFIMTKYGVGIQMAEAMQKGAEVCTQS